MTIQSTKFLIYPYSQHPLQIINKVNLNFSLDYYYHYLIIFL